MDKKLIYTAVDAAAPLLTALSDQIWEYAELSMEETKSCDAYIKALQQEGFTVKKAVAGIPTAFTGSYGSGRPVIGILAEYDALSGLSQVPEIAEKQCQIPGGNGHGCGHNLLGAASLGAAIAIKKQIDAGLLSGTVVLYGCPGEEGCAGKTFMAREGMFRDLDAALCWHPGDVNQVTTGSCAACLQLRYTFTGTSAHAAGDPEHGRSALDAAELMNIGVQFLREHMEKTCSVHYAFDDAGGISPNVVQPTASLIYMIRAETVKKAKALLQRVNHIAQGAALMTDTAFTVQQIDGTANTLSNQVMEKVIYENMLLAPLPEYTQQEEGFASALKKSFPEDSIPGDLESLSPVLRAELSAKTNGFTNALNDFVIPYEPSFHFSPGSTDVGDVSWLTPTAQFSAVTWVSGSPGHSWQNVSIGKSSIAHKGMLYAAKVLAATCADLMANPQLLADAKKEFSVTAVDGYDCPIDKTVKIP